MYGNKCIPRARLLSTQPFHLLILHSFIRSFLHSFIFPFLHPYLCGKNLRSMDLSNFDPNGPTQAGNNIFGLPSDEESACVVLLPVPWETTVSYHTGTARGPEHMLNASRQVDLYDADEPDGWRKGFFMRKPDNHILRRSDYLRKEAELYVSYLLEGGIPEENKYMQKSLQEVNKGSQELNEWVYEQTRGLLSAGKLTGLVGGDHSTPLGFLRAIGEKYNDFGILHIDAHLDLRKAYTGFTYSHASIMYNALQEVPQISRLVSIGVRDYCEEELQRVQQQPEKISVFFDQDIREKKYEGMTWQQQCDEITGQLPEKVYLSFDIDGLDPKLCPHTGTPVAGGFETGEIFYLLKRMLATGRQLIGFDLVEVCPAHDSWDANVGARILFKLCSLLSRRA